MMFVWLAALQKAQQLEHNQHLIDIINSAPHEQVEHYLQQNDNISLPYIFLVAVYSAAPLSPQTKQMAALNMTKFDTISHLDVEYFFVACLHLMPQIINVQQEILEKMQHIMTQALPERANTRVVDFYHEMTMYLLDNNMECAEQWCVAFSTWNICLCKNQELLPKLMLTLRYMLNKTVDAMPLLFDKLFPLIFFVANANGYWFQEAFQDCINYSNMNHVLIPECIKWYRNEEYSKQRIKFSIMITGMASMKNGKDVLHATLDTLLKDSSDVVPTYELISDLIEHVDYAHVVNILNMYIATKENSIPVMISISQIVCSAVLQRPDFIPTDLLHDYVHHTLSDVESGDHDVIASIAYCWRQVLHILPLAIVKKLALAAANICCLHNRQQSRHVLPFLKDIRDNKFLCKQLGPPILKKLVSGIRLLLDLEAFEFADVTFESILAFGKYLGMMELYTDWQYIFQHAKMKSRFEDSTILQCCCRLLIACNQNIQQLIINVYFEPIICNLNPSQRQVIASTLFVRTCLIHAYPSMEHQTKQIEKWANALKNPIFKSMILSVVLYRKTTLRYTEAKSFSNPASDILVYAAFAARFPIHYAEKLLLHSRIGESHYYSNALIVHGLAKIVSLNPTVILHHPSIAWHKCLTNSKLCGANMEIKYWLNVAIANCKKKLSPEQIQQIICTNIKYKTLVASLTRSISLFESVPVAFCDIKF